jgi:glucosamine--fructose-6-phosphate aminotransferase (isomerizing)
MTDAPTHMAEEIAETPHAVQRLLDGEAANIAAIGRKLRDAGPPVVVTCARGSSDNAAAYFKYLTEMHLGVPVASMGPSIASVYQRPLRLKGAMLVAVSQSGQSPDIVALQAAARAGGAYAVSIVNQADSPLAHQADAVVALHAGEERSVAATKSCLASAVALAAIVAEWADDDALRKAVRRLPETLAGALACDWSAALDALAPAASAYVIGRGPALPVAAEAALKLKETAMLHAEAFSGAEVMHGPLQVLKPGFPVIAFRQADASADAMTAAVARLRGAKGHVFVADTAPDGPDGLPVAATGHGALDPLSALLSFYGLAETVARTRGHAPDAPSLLRKVTETI